MDKAKKNISFYISITFFLILLGFIISSQAQRQIEVVKTKNISSRYLNDLVVVLKETQDKRDSLEIQIKKLKKQLHYFDKENSTISLKQYKKLYKFAGLTDYKGEGIVLNLNNNNLSKLHNENDIFLNNCQIQSDDILKLINELKASGAKAISVNNQRIVTTTEIVTSGNHIMINQTRLMPPYEVKAIGKANIMLSALNIRGGILEYLKVFGISINLKKENLLIPAYNGAY